MKRGTALVLLAAVASVGEANLLRGADQQPIYEGSIDTDAQFGSSAQSDKPGRAPGYRSAWDDCGGVGASATERMRTIAAKIKGWAKPLPFVRHAAQDCGTVDKTGTKPGPGTSIVYPGPEIPATARAGLDKAEKTLAKYPAPAALLSTANQQPIYEGSIDTDAQFGSSAQSDKPGRAPGYRSAWDDCGGVGASATERMRTIAAKIKGWAKPLPFVRHAAQDCGTVDKAGTKPGPGTSIVYPGPEIPATARAGLAKAEKTLAKYPAPAALLSTTN